MPITRNTDQTLSLQDEGTNTAPTLNLELGGFDVASPRSNAQPPRPVASRGDGLDLTLPANMDSVKELDLTLPDEKIEPAIDSTVSQDIVGGLAQGILGESFTASAATILESWTGANARIMFTDEEGELTTPYYMSSNEFSGRTEEEWDNMSAKARRIAISKATRERTTKMAEADPDSISYTIANLTGMLMDPTTFIPVLGQSMKARAAYGAGVGGTDMAAYQTAQEGAPTAGGVALGVVLGGTLSALTKAPRTMGHKDPVLRKEAQAKVKDVFNTMNANMAAAKQANVSPVSVMDDTLRKLGINSDQLDQLLMDSGHSSTRYMANKPRDITLLDRVIEPISERLKRISPRLWKQAQQMERKTHEVFHNYSTTADDFIRKDLERLNSRFYGNYNPEAYRKIKTAMLTGDEATFKRLAKDNLKDGWRKNYANYLRTMRSTYKLMKKYRGHKSTPLGKQHKVYLHRAVKDYKAIQKALGTEDKVWLQKYIDKKYPHGATEKELNRAYTDFLSGKMDVKGARRVPSGAKSRKLTQKHFDEHPELVDAFHDPAKATHSYLKSSIEDSYNKAFFGKKIIAKHGDDLTTGIDGSFADLAQQEVKAGRMNIDDVDELKKLLALRFVEGVQGPNKVIQQFKDLSYASLLGNPISAVTQLGDIALATAKYGIRDTLSSVVTSLGKRGFTAKEFGLMDSILEEMVSDAGTKGFLSKSLRMGGFSAVDSLGKAVNLNAAFRRAVRQSKSTKGLINLRAKWGKAYGDDFAELANDLAQGKVTEHTKTLVFAELADVQPITLLEMPEMYLSMKNGRLFYMLKTFQLKYFNMLRQHSFAEFKRGNYAAGIKTGGALLSAYIAGGMATDSMKAAFMGRDFYAEDALTNNILKTTGVIDRYSLGKLSASTDPVGKLMENTAPPLNTLSPVVVTAMNLAATGEIAEKDAAKLIGQVPVIGKLIQNFLLGGMEEFNEKRWKEH